MMKKKELSVGLSNALEDLRGQICQYLIQDEHDLHGKVAVLERFLANMQGVLPEGVGIDDEELYLYWKTYKAEEKTWHTQTAPAYKAATTASYPKVLKGAIAQLQELIKAARRYLDGYATHKEAIVGAVMQQKFKAFTQEVTEALDAPKEGWLALLKLLEEQQTKHEKAVALVKELKGYIEEYKALVQVWKTRVVPNANALLVDKEDLSTTQELVKVLEKVKAFFEKAPEQFKSNYSTWSALANSGKWEQRLTDLEILYERSKKRQAASLEDGNPAIAESLRVYHYKAPNKKSKLYQKGKGDKHAIAANDVQQGDLDDCYVLGPLAALAQSNPDWIKKMIEAQEDGTYKVTLYLRKEAASNKREKTEVIVQPEFVYNKKGKAAYAGEGDKEVWVQVIEKAYAQALGHYDAIAEGGEAQETFEVFTGKKATKGKIQEKEKEELENILKEALKNKKAITLSSIILPNKQKDQKLDKNQKVVTNHVYYLTAIESGILQLQNPLGKDHLAIDWTIVNEYFNCYTIL